MTTQERRKKISEILKNSDKPIKGTDFAKKLEVSRQVIVQDIAILRAGGIEVLATPVGYTLYKHDKDKIIKAIVTKHADISQVKDELMIIVNNGGKVINVVVEHPIYGEVEGALNLACKSDVDEFLEQIETGEAEFLSSLTDGVHIHNIEVPNNQSFVKIKQQLKSKGYLVEEL